MTHHRQILFRFWDDKVNISYLSFQTKNEIFFHPFLSSLPFLLKAGVLSLLLFNQLFVLKRVQMYEMNFTIQIYLQIFSLIFLFFLATILYLSMI
jgi:hypothetical protein